MTKLVNSSSKYVSKGIDVFSALEFLTLRARYDQQLGGNDVVDNGFNGWNREPCRLLSHRMRSNSVYLGVEYIAKGELRESLRQIIDQFSGRGVYVFLAV